MLSYDYNSNESFRIFRELPAEATPLGTVDTNVPRTGVPFGDFLFEPTLPEYTSQSSGSTFPEALMRVPEFATISSLLEQQYENLDSASERALSKLLLIQSWTVPMTQVLPTCRMNQTIQNRSGAIHRSSGSKLCLLILLLIPLI